MAHGMMRPMKQFIGRIAILGGILVLGGCAAPAPAPAESVAPAPAACQSVSTHKVCTGVLVNVAVAANASYRAMDAPAQAQTAAYEAMSDVSGDWSRQCKDKTAPARVGDDLECFALVERLSTAALVIDPSLRD